MSCSYLSELALARNVVLDLIDKLAVGLEWRLSLMLVDESGAEKDFTVNNREFNPERVRTLISAFLPDHLDTGYIAIWPEGAAARTWLDTAYLVHEHGPGFILSLFKDRLTLLPEIDIDPSIVSAVKSFCSVPQYEILTIDHLKNKGLVTSAGELDRNLHILAASGHHSAVAGQYVIMGVDPCKLRNPGLLKTVLKEPMPANKIDFILRRCRLFIRKDESDALSLSQLAAAENKVENLLGQSKQMFASALSQMRNAVPYATSHLAKLLMAKLKLPNEPTLKEIVGTHGQVKLPDTSAHAMFRISMAGGVENSDLKNQIVTNQYPALLKLVLSSDEVYLTVYHFAKRRYRISAA